jgi:hypothetical protein
MKTLGGMSNYCRHQAPPGGTPCVRFGHAIAASNHVDVEIEQDGVIAKWTDYHFGQFSDCAPGISSLQQ